MNHNSSTQTGMFSLSHDGGIVAQWVLLVLLFLFNPTICLVVELVILLSKRKLTYSDYISLAVALAAWLSVINMTKVPESDHIHYMNYYNNIDTKNLWYSILYYRYDIAFKEIFFAIYSVFIYVISGGNGNFYNFTISFLIYILHFAAIIQIISLQTKDRFYILSAMALLTFCLPFWGQTLHAIRQFMACSFIIYAMAYRVRTGRQLWLFIILAALTHVMSILLVVILLIPFITERMTRAQIISLSIGVIGFIALYTMIGQYLALLDIESIQYAGQRMMKQEDQDFSQFSITAFYIYAIPMFIASVSILNRVYQRNEYNSTIIITYFFLILSLIILSFSSRPTMQGRFFMFAYSLFPFLIVQILPFKNNVNKFICLFLVLFLCYHFFHDSWGWHYAPLSDIITKNFFYFLNNKFYII